MSARTDALVSQQETGKITASIVLRCGRLPPGMSYRFNADSEIMFRVEPNFLGAADGRSAIGLPPRLPHVPKVLSKMLRNIRSRVQF
jgi:hypothetical protein